MNEDDLVMDENELDPAAAFAALRGTIEKMARDLTSEMTVIRKGVETAFEEFEKFQQPPDYGPDLAAIVQKLGNVGERLHGVEQTPLLRQGAEHYAAVLGRGGEGLVKAAVQALERQATDLECVGRNLSVQLDGARERQRQNRLLWGVGAAGLVAGVLLTLFAPRVLPFSVAPRVASVVMGDKPWQAGMSLMAFDSPVGWNRVVTADKLIEANKADIATCRDVAAKARKEQRCTITVPVPAQ